VADGETVQAAGAVLWRPGATAAEVAVVHRPKYDDWSLPKGKLDHGEAAVAAAVREVREETGATAVVERALGTSRYTVAVDGRDVPKTVRWWSMRATGGRFEPCREVDAIRWLPAADALALLSDGEPLRRWMDGPLRTRTLLLVRHARAGSRADWAGDDDARPLDERGRAQADALAPLLALYGPQRLLAAPIERCTATLDPLSRELGLPVETDEALSAEGWDRESSRGLALLRALVVDGRTAVVCSQGEVLPEALDELAGQVLVGAQPGTPKGGGWALSFDESAGAVDADRLDPPA
jgi:8-oxo-dGTP diphosphatase